MSQEHNVLRCFSCEMYQVHIVKKAKKWQCKICNVKQSFRRVFFQGSGKDCRIHVQKLNAMKAYENEGNASFEMDCDVDYSNCSNDCSEQQSRANTDENEEAKYLNPSEGIQFSSFQTSNSMTYNFKGNNDSKHSHIDNAGYKYLHTDYTNSNSCYEKELEGEFYYNNESKDDDTLVEGACNNMPSNFSNSKNDFCNKDTNGRKEAENIFDDNEEFDLAIDF